MAIMKLFGMLREQFELEKLKLNHPNPEDFSTCCWQKPKTVHPAWLAYRAVMCAFFLATFVYVVVAFVTDDEIPESDKPKILIYISYWTYALETVVFVFALGVTMWDFIIQRKGTWNGERTSVCAKIYWVVYTIVVPSSHIVTVVFWWGLYDSDFHKMNASNILLHLTNVCAMVIDYALTPFPYRFLHFYIPTLYAFIYLIFTLIYELSGGWGVKGQKPIYTIIDWVDTPYKTAVHVLATAVGLLFIHILFSFLYVLKLWLRKNSFGSSEI